MLSVPLLDYEGAFNYPSSQSGPRTFLIVPLTIQMPSLHQFTMVAQEC